MGQLTLRTFLAMCCTAGASALVAGCGGSGSGSTISADGSSTVGPFTTAAAEGFRKESDVGITVGISGTGGGFDRFCRGETDISNASRPIKDSEQEICEQNSVEYVELHVANDALTIVVNNENDWATCLTVAELAKMWEPGSTIKNWSQVRDGFPNVPLRLFGAGTDSGTFDYFTGEIVGEEGASRTDYSASEDDNVTVQGVSGEKGGLGYFGFSYFEQNQGTLNALEVDGGAGCVAPGVASAQSGEYTPLSRPLFVYVRKTSLERKEAADFVKYVLDNEETIAERAQFVPLNAEQLAKARADLQAALDEVRGQ